MLDALAAEMLGVYRGHRLVRTSSVRIETLSLDQAYDVQARVVGARVAAGERVVGRKVGCTSPAVQAQFGLAQPVTAQLLAPHVHPSGSRLEAIPHCAVEPELVLTVAQDIHSEDVSDDELLAAIGSVAAGGRGGPHPVPPRGAAAPGAD